MKFFILLLLIFVSSCTSMRSGLGEPRSGKASYSYTDVNQTYRLEREVKIVDKKIVTRTQLLDPATNKLLEKTVAVAQLGSIAGKKNGERLLSVRPFASEFSVWLEGKKYFSQLKMNASTKSMSVHFQNPDGGEKVPAAVRFPKGQFFCFYSQIPDCLYHSQLLSRALELKGEAFAFVVVWDSYPFVQDQFNGISNKLFAKGIVKFEAEEKQILRFVVELDGQVITYHFTKSFDLLRVAWIAQGISIVPPGEELTDED